MDADSWVQGWIQNRGKTRDDGGEAWCWLVHLSIQTENIQHLRRLCVCKGAQLDKTTSTVFGIVEFMYSVFLLFYKFSFTL